MNEFTILQIINLCIEINRKATDIYKRLSLADQIKNLRGFWTEMAAEEKKYAEFWELSKKSANHLELTYIFDNPSDTKRDLEKLLEKVDFLLRRWESHQSIENALILAYRLEYYMLHPVFEVFYRTLKLQITDFDPEQTHDRHIKRFIAMFVEYGSVTPELELLGETLQSLWQRNKDLTKIAMVDGLTGLYNRRGFLILAKEMFYLAQRRQENTAILMIDVDKFKNINDKYGHQTGDDILKKNAGSLMSNVRKPDIVGRIGGEEFIILFPDIMAKALKPIAEKIRAGVENLRPSEITVTISIGIKQGLITSNPNEELYTWMSNADTNLYRAKANGRNCVAADF